MDLCRVPHRPQQVIAVYPNGRRGVDPAAYGVSADPIGFRSFPDSPLGHSSCPVCDTNRVLADPWDDSNLLRDLMAKTAQAVIGHS